jgi:hypothetical protein
MKLPEVKHQCAKSGEAVKSATLNLFLQQIRNFRVSWKGSVQIAGSYGSLPGNNGRLAENGRRRLYVWLHMQQPERASGGG